jgi:hypothetical protein
VVELLGEAPEQLATRGPNLVLRGGALVAKLGPAAARPAAALSLHLPLATPRLVDHGPGWLVTEEVPDHGGAWNETAVFELVGDLAELHAFDPAPLVGSALDEPLTAWWRRVGHNGNLAVALPAPLRRVLDDPTPLFELLRAAPRRLVHGDPYRHNVRRPTPGQRVWIDWDDALLGPPELDVAAWMLEGHWFLGRRVTFDEVRAAYRASPPTDRAPAAGDGAPAAGDGALAAGDGAPAAGDGAPAPLDDARLAAAILLVTASQDLVALREEEGEQALGRFVAERLDALDHLGLAG